MTGMIPHSVLDSLDVGPHRAIALCCEALDVLYEARPRRPPSDAERLRVEAFQVGDIVLTSYQGGANSYDRSRTRIGRDGQDSFMLQLLLSGGWTRRDGKARAEAGDIVVMDMAQPQSMLGTDNTTLHLCVPRRLLAPSLTAADEHNMRVVRGTEPLAALFRTYLVTLFEQLATLSLEEAEAALRPAVDLAAAAINGGVREDQVDAVDFALVEQIRRYIDAHAGEADLNVETVAGRFGLARRKLYYLFEPYGGVAAYIQKTRLSRIRAALADPAHRHETIEDMASRHGFAHYRSFARAFERQFGLSPRALRALLAAGRPVHEPSPDPRVAWAGWLRDLR